MTTWAGTDQMRSITAPRGLRRRRWVPSRHEPAEGSIHLVDDSGETACRTVDVAQLTRLDRPWDQWHPLYRCRKCDALEP